MSNKNFGFLNPKQCADAIQDKQLVINAEFSKITEETLRKDDFKENSPQKIFGRFSRFTLSILDGTSVSSNIKINQVAGIRKRSDFAANLQYESEFSKDESSNETVLSPAYTVKFVSGNLKGKTPAQVLIENPEDGQNTLNEQYKFLSKNADKYPNNRVIMDAIKDAAGLLSSGQLSSEKATASCEKSFDILKEVPKPNIYKKIMVNGVEMSPTHSLHIFYTQGAKYSVTVKIQNYNCPVKETENGGVNALVSKMDKDSYQKGEINLDMDTWLGIVSELERQLCTFAIVNGSDAFKLADKINYENQQNAKK